MNNNLIYKNYKEPLTKVVDGHGYYGTIAHTQCGGKIQCHICGFLYKDLSSHLRNTHKMTSKQYRERFQIAKKPR